MKATIIQSTVQNEFTINLNTQPHNIRFAGRTAPHILSFQIKHFPTKLLLEYLKNTSSYQDIQNIRGYLLIICKVQGVDVHFQVDYQTVKSISPKVKQYTDQSVTFFVLRHHKATAQERKAIYKIAAPYAAQLDKKAARFLENWKYPQTLEETISMLSNEQKEKAVKLLYEAFVS